MVTTLRSCPPWCVSAHGSYDGEEDSLHVGEPVNVAEGLTAVLCLSVDPETGALDGPYVLVGSRELTLSEAENLSSELRGLVERAIMPNDEQAG